MRRFKVELLIKWLVFFVIMGMFSGVLLISLAMIKAVLK